MDIQAIFGLQFLLSLLAWGVIAGFLLRAQLRSPGRLAGAALRVLNLGSTTKRRPHDVAGPSPPLRILPDTNRTTRPHGGRFDE